MQHTAKIVIVVLLLAALFLQTAVYAQADIARMDVVFDIQQDNSVSQTSKFFFDSPFSDASLQYRLTDPAKNIEAFDGTQKLAAELVNITGGYIINISLKQPIQNLTLSYVTDKAVFQSDSVDYFFTELSFEKAIGNITVQVKLPEGFGVYENSFHPSDAQLLSDGKRIVLMWNEQNAVNPLTLSVKFTRLDDETNIIIAAVALLAGIVVLVYLYFRERTREEFMTGFRADEQKAIEYLQQKKVALQSDLQKEFHFSRAKATRIVSRLEEKGLLRKQRYGRTNKLSWLR